MAQDQRQSVVSIVDQSDMPAEYLGRLRGWRFTLLNVATGVANVVVLSNVPGYTILTPYVGGDLQGVTQNPRYDFCSRKLFRVEWGSSALFVSRSGRRRCAMTCDDGFDRIPGLFGAFWPRLHRPHHQFGASEGENAALVIMTLLT